MISNVFIFFNFIEAAIKKRPAFYKTGLFSFIFLVSCRVIFCHLIQPVAGMFFASQTEGKSKGQSEHCYQTSEEDLDKFRSNL